MATDERKPQPIRQWENRSALADLHDRDHGVVKIGQPTGFLLNERATDPRDRGQKEDHRDQRFGK